MLGPMTGVEAAINRLPTDYVPPLPAGDTVTIGANLLVADTRIGWTSVHSQNRSATTKAIIGAASTIQNQHLMGFGANTDVEVRVLTCARSGSTVTLGITPGFGWKAGDPIDVVGVGAPFDGSFTVVSVNAATTSITYTTVSSGTVASAAAPAGAVARNWDFMDSTFGYPTAASGYFSSAVERCVTFCGCPAYMRSPKPGATWDPQGVRSGTQLTSMSDYTPPNSSYVPEYAATCAAFMVRYPHVKYWQFWNELKGYYYASQYPGSNVVPVGSGLPVDTSASSNRWWSEGYTYAFNEAWVAIKAVRPDSFGVGPYPVLNSLSWDQASDWADDAFPDLYMGPWGYGDKKNLRLLRYFIRYCTGVDALAVDIRNLPKDSSSLVYYNPPSVPATPDPANKFLTNPEGGAFPRYWKEGQEDGAWNAGRKQVDFLLWLRALGASSTVYQRPVADARSLPIWYAEWYAYEDREQFKNPDPATGLYYPQATSSHAGEACATAWQWLDTMETLSYVAMMWKPEGSVQGNINDPGDSNPLALYYQLGSPLSLQKTELAPVVEGIVTHFPVGTQMKQVVTSSKYLRGCASASVLMICNRKPTPMSFSLVDPNSGTPIPVTLAGHEVRFITR